MPDEHGLSPQNSPAPQTSQPAQPDQPAWEDPAVPPLPEAFTAPRPPVEDPEGSPTAQAAARPKEGGGISFRRACSRVGAAFSVMMLLFVLGQTAFLALFQRFWPGLIESSAGLWLCTDLALYGLGAPAAWLLLRGVLRAAGPAPRPAHPARMTLPWAGRLFCLGELLMMAGNLAGLGITRILAHWTGGTPVNAVAQVLDGSSMLANIVFCVLVAAVGEELLFRELLFRALAPFGERAYLLLSALLFALFHGNLNQIPYAFLLGLLLAWMRCRTGRAGWGMLLHGAINFCGGILPFLIQESTTLMLVWGWAVIAFCVTGGIYLFRIRPPRRGPKPRGPREPGPLGPHPARQALLNPGMLAALGLSLLLLAGTTLSTMGIGM